MTQSFPMRRDSDLREGGVGIGSELLLVVDEQRASGGGHEAADGEGGQLHPHRGDPVGLPSALVVPDRDEHSTGAAPTNPAESEGRDREHREAHVVQAGGPRDVDETEERVSRGAVEHHGYPSGVGAKYSKRVVSGKNMKIGVHIGGRQNM